MTIQRILNARSIITIARFVGVLTFLVAGAATAIAQNPVPFVDQPLVPDTIAPGGPALSLTVNGAGFVAGSVVNWNGSPRATTFVSRSKLTATILSSDIATASTATVTVVSPSPGGGVSNTQFFSIVVAEASISFPPAVPHETGGINPSSVAIADVNGDGKPDLIVANQCSSANNCPIGEGSVGVLLGNGNGTFQAPVDYDAGSTDPNSVIVTDVNRDGKLDIVVVGGCIPAQGCFAEGVAAVLLGNGDGTFQPAVPYGSGGVTGVSVAAADVNGDGKLDLQVANQCAIGSCAEGSFSEGLVGVLLGNGDGTFQPAVTYSSGGNFASSVAVANLNGDGKLDLVVTNYCSVACFFPPVEGSVSVLLGNGDGTFQPAVPYDSGGNGTMSVSVADVSGDGKLDLLTANCGDDACSPASTGGVVGVLLGNGDGTFKAAVSFAAGNSPDSITVADVNGDGKPDVVVGNWGTSSFNNDGATSVLLGNGDGTFQAAQTYLSGGNEATSVAVADLTGDGRLDIVLGDYGSEGSNPPSGIVSALLNSAPSSQSPTTTTMTSSLNPSSYGQRVTFTASVSSTAGTPTGTVIFSDASTSTTLGSATLSTGSAAISVSSLAAGTHSITAAYQGFATFSGSTSTPLSQTVKIATTTTALASSENPAATGQPVSFTATVTSQFGGASTGSVTFLSGSQTLGTASLSGNHAVLSTSLTSSGTYSISAKYGGDSNNAGSTSSVLSQVIIPSTTTTLVSSLNPSLVGQAITFTAIVSSIAGAPPNGELITFKDGSSVLGTAALTGGIAALTTSSLPAGIDTITAAYAGDANFSGSTSPGLRQVVNGTTKSATATTLVSSLNPSIYGQSVTWKAKVTTLGSVPPTGTVNFAWDGYSIGTATLNVSGVATLTKSNLNVYTYPLTAVYSGDANNAGSTSAVLNQVVKEATSAAALSSSLNPSTQGQAVTFTATISSPTVTATGPVTFTAGTTVLGTVQLSGGKAKFTTSTLPVGSTAVKATCSGDSNITESSASVTQTVQQ